jgi:hypothetical protein
MVSDMTKEIRARVRAGVFALLPHSNMESYAWNVNM